ncbi:MAG: hypothetical protein ACRKFN_02135 [Desulfitobacterium sp.]
MLANIFIIAGIALYGFLAVGVVTYYNLKFRTVYSNGIINSTIQNESECIEALCAR